MAMKRIVPDKKNRYTERVAYNRKCDKLLCDRVHYDDRWPGAKKQDKTLATEFVNEPIHVKRWPCCAIIDDVDNFVALVAWRGTSNRDGTLHFIISSAGRNLDDNSSMV
ncbi:hypothetical protein WN55_04614 [Dufourea novaeangliae]|uniref:Uncharacterized protein n=1 Tax=Dufourea novaeangliae TaxID=178035 RepID=A0A154P2V3_DUFNO|nr:hypothetical protein WN55_04614 [Dufourea novaeangliae]